MNLYRQIIPSVSAALLLLGSMTGIAAAAPQPTSVAGVQAYEVTVESVDPATREILVSEPDGSLMTVVAGKQLRNFSQIQAGDKVRLTYHQEIAVKLAPPGAPAPAPTVALAAGRSALGQMPAGAVYAMVHEQVRIDAVDKATGKVSFTRTDGSTGSVVPRHPDMIDFAKQLKPGDQVEVDAAQALSVVVVKRP